MNLYDIYVIGDPYDTVWADSESEAVELFLADHPALKEFDVAAYMLYDDELWLPDDDL